MAPRQDVTVCHYAMCFFLGELGRAHRQRTEERTPLARADEWPCVMSDARTWGPVGNGCAETTSPEIRPREATGRDALQNAAFK